MDAIIDDNRSSRKKAQQKKKRLEYKLRVRERNIFEWDQMSPEEREVMKQTRRDMKESAHQRMKEGINDGLKVCLDLSFNVDTPKVNGGDCEVDSKDTLKDKRELHSVAKQLSLAYGVVKKVMKPLNLHITSFQSESYLGNCIVNQGSKCAHTHALFY